MTTIVERKRIEVRGTVQGVGFRPFVYRMAARYDLCGTVRNSSQGVAIEVEGGEESLAAFLRALESELPPLAHIDQIKITAAAPRGEPGFVIQASVAGAEGFALVPPDIATCEDCYVEFTTPGDRRYGYPFTNCTHCGPRYGIIRDVPYDRGKTTLEPFTMCALCQAEYQDPASRRFHAEPNACPDCGPSLTLTPGGELSSGDAILARVRELLQRGEILAIKGLGGFHLACDAANDCAVSLLRERKRRSGKAFAVMARDLETANRLCEIARADRELLVSARRPIVLLRRRPDTGLARDVAPGIATLGLMLPYTPLHHLLFRGSPGYDSLVMTSGNLSEEPMVRGNAEALSRLSGLADHFLLHNREIQTCVDDSVVQTFEGRPYPLRRSRGYAPEPIDVGRPVRQILACGGERKNTLCLTKDHYAILSQHIGDLENLETMDLFRETLGHLRRFFRVSPEAVAYDLHPHYLSTRFALEESGFPAVGVQHHHAHIASCMADNGLRGRVLGVALDGTGYGTDGRIWGGEFLACDFGGFERRGHLRYVPLAGGDQAVRQPWRSALAYLGDAFGADARSLPLPLFREISPPRIALIDAMLARRVQTIDSSSCGRLFDAVASLLGVRHETTYEGQAAMELEAAASDASGSYPFLLAHASAGAGIDSFELDLRPAVREMVQDFCGGAPVPDVSARFHRTLAQAVVQGCLRVQAADGLHRVCLSGGTFQNLRLLRGAVDGLREAGFEVFTHRRVPPNDGGLALGQALIAQEILCR